MSQTVTHFAGINTARLAAATEGLPVLISFADIQRRPGVWARDILPRLEAGAWSSVILDSGAFTVISTPKFHINVEAYAAFAAEYGHLFDVIVNLDDIAGNLTTTHRNQAVLEAAGVQALPVFHQDEPWEALEAYLAKHDHIGVGFARKPGGKLKYPAKVNRVFLQEFFKRVGDRARVHGFAMTSWVKEGFKFDTVDSTSWIAEYRAVRTMDTSEPVPVTPKVLVAGELASMLSHFGADELLSLVLESYSPGSRAAHRMVEGPERGMLQSVVERCSRSQARTVFLRYGPARLALKLDTLNHERSCA